MYTVDWTRDAYEQGDAIFLSLDPQDQLRMAEIVPELNRQLSVDPLVMGESRDGDQRIVFADSLAFRYRVDATSQTVTVYGVRLMGRA